MEARLANLMKEHKLANVVKDVTPKPEVIEVLEPEIVEALEDED